MRNGPGGFVLLANPAVAKWLNQEAIWSSFLWLIQPHLGPLQRLGASSAQAGPTWVCIQLVGSAGQKLGGIMNFDELTLYRLTYAVVITVPDSPQPKFREDVFEQVVLRDVYPQQDPIKLSKVCLPIGQHFQNFSMARLESHSPSSSFVDTQIAEAPELDCRCKSVSTSRINLESDHG